MREAVHFLGFGLISSGCAGVALLCVNACLSLQQTAHWQTVPVTANAPTPVYAQAAHHRLPFVIKP